MVDDSDLVGRVTEEIAHDVEGSLKAVLDTVGRQMGVEPMELAVDRSARRSLLTRLQELGQDPAQFPDWQGTLHVLLVELSRLELLLQNFQGFFQRDNLPNVRREKVSLSSVFQETILMFSGEAAAKDIEIRFEIVDADEIWVDPHLFERLLFNLVDNAMKYSFPTTKESRSRFIDLKARRHSAAGDWLLEVSSYGPGVAPEERQRVFEYGFRGVRAREKRYPGSGVGLAEVLRIAKAHRGTASLESTEVGTSVYVTRVSVILWGRLDG